MEKELYTDLEEIKKLEKGVRDECWEIQGDLLDAMKAGDEEEVKALGHEIKNKATIILQLMEIRKLINDKKYEKKE